MRWPLYLTVNVCLIALVGTGLLGIVEQNTRAESAERASVSRTLSGLIAGWDAAGTPPEKRVLDVFIGAEPEESFLDAPSPRPFWAAVPAWLRRSAAKARHDGEEEALLGHERPVADWYAEDWVWASERRGRLKALSAYMAKARQGNARLVVLSDGREAATVLAAEQAAEPSTTDLVVTDRLIVFGADADAVVALKYPDAAGAQFPSKIREALLLQRASPSAAAQLVLRDAYGRVVTATLSGADATEDGAARLIRLLASSSDDMESVLVREGQIAALPPPPPDPAALRRLAAQEAARRDAAARQAAEDAARTQIPTPPPAPPLAPPKSGRPARAPTAVDEANSSSGMSFDVPAGWQHDEDTQMTDGGTEGDVHIGSRWFSASGKTAGWADIVVRSFPMTGRAEANQGAGCPDIPLRSVQDLRDELDCSVPQSCAPCSDKKCPRGPVGGFCGQYTGTVAAAGTKGFLYNQVFDPEDVHGMGPDVNFNRALRVIEIVVQPVGAQTAFTLEYYAPKSEFDRYLPVFERVARSLRVAAKQP